MATTWYYEIMGEEVGPVSSAELRKLAVSKVIDRFTPIRPTNGKSSTPAYRIKGLFPDEHIASEIDSETVPKTPTIPAIRTEKPTTSVEAKPVRKLDNLTMFLASALCLFVLATVVLGGLLLLNHSNSAQSQLPSEVQSQLPPIESQAKAGSSSHRGDVPVVSPSVDESASTAAPEKLVESEPMPSSDKLIVAIAKQLGVEAVFAIKVGDVTLLVGVDQMRAYVPKNVDHLSIRGTAVGFHTRFVTADNRIDKPSAGFIPVNGKPEEVKIYSSDPDLIKVFSDGSASVRGAGDATVFVECAGKRISVPIQIYETPFTIGFGKSKSKDVVEALGIPQRKTTHVVSWPDSEIIDQMYYGPDVGAQRRGDHWEYDKLPGLCVQVVGDFVESIGMRDRPNDFTPEIIWQ